MTTSKDCHTNEFSVEVNLIGRDLEPDQITTILGLEPASTARAGDPRPTSKTGEPYEEGFWIHEVSSLDDVTHCRDHELNCLADAIAPHVERLRSSGVERICFYYTLSSSIGLMNIKFKADTMAKLSQLQADLYVSCFDCFDPQHPFWTLSLDGASSNGG